MNDQELVIQEWMEFGIDEDLLKTFVSYLEKKIESPFNKQVVSIWVPTDEDGNGKIVEMPVPIEVANGGPHTHLPFFLNQAYTYAIQNGWKNYLSESLKYNLPPWNDDFLQIGHFYSGIDEIIRNHTYIGRINNLFYIYWGDIEQEFSFEEIDVIHFKEVIINKLKNDRSLNCDEEKILEFVLKFNIKNEDFNGIYFPKDMTKDEIILAIKAAYQNASRISKMKWNGIKYKGEYKKMTIHFIFDFNSNFICDAYPVYDNK
jgi:hypothetical protein